MANHIHMFLHSHTTNKSHTQCERKTKKKNEKKKKQTRITVKTVRRKKCAYPEYYTPELVKEAEGIIIKKYAPALALTLPSVYRF